MKKSNNIFERYPKSTLFGIVTVLGFLSLAIMEILASFFGLGKTVIYAAHPVYGYRPAPNQIVLRQSEIKINNLGLRAEHDWDSSVENKILFLGDSVTYGGSYLSNSQLFSELSVKNIPGFIAGNAGVNGWGVDNVYALVKEMEFLPAQIYVSVFPEGDFYRGITRIGGQPFWTHQPRFALEELFQYLVYKTHIKKVTAYHFNRLPSAEQNKVAKISVRHLKELDDYLKANNKIHLIYISPSCPQVLGKASTDEVIKKLLSQYNLKVIYLKDRLKNLPENEKISFFHDEIHLTPKGHEMWATLIAPDLQHITTEELISHENKNT